MWLLKSIDKIRAIWDTLHTLQVCKKGSSASVAAWNICNIHRRKNTYQEMAVSVKESKHQRFHSFWLMKFNQQSSTPSDKWRKSQVDSNGTTIQYSPYYNHNPPPWTW